MLDSPYYSFLLINIILSHIHATLSNIILPLLLAAWGLARLIKPNGQTGPSEKFKNVHCSAILEIQRTIIIMGFYLTMSREYEKLFY